MKTIRRHEESTGRTFRLTPETLELAFEKLHKKRGAFALVTIEKTLGLTRTDLGRLFGVSRQAVDGWMRDGVPEPRNAEISRTLAVTLLLRKRFVADRIPAIVRGPLPGLGGRSILATLMSDGTTPIFGLLERLASFVPAA